MTVVAAAIAGALASTVLLRCTGGVLAKPVLDRENYRGHHLPTAVGVVLVAAVVAVDGGRTLLGVAGVGQADTAPARMMLLAAVVMFGFLGLLDDLLGDGEDRGLRGHVGAALRGRVTTGFIKLGGGAAVALVLAGAIDGDAPGRVLADAALIALAANLGNLLDRAPGPHHQVGAGRLRAGGAGRRDGGQRGGARRRGRRRRRPPVGRPPRAVHAR